MGLFNILDPALDVILGPFARMSPALGLILITFLVSLLIVLIYKLTTDQKHMKSLRERVKKYQQRMKELKKNPEEMMKVQKKMMAVNMELMKHSMRPTLYTFIPIIIIFGWLAAHFAYYPVAPGEPFNVTLRFSKGTAGNVTILIPSELELLSPATAQISEESPVASWTLKGPEGEYQVFFDFNNEKLQKRVAVSDKRGVYAKAVKTKKSLFDYIYSGREGFIPKESRAVAISVSYSSVKPLPFTIFGWKPGWLGTYIIFSFAFSILLRKLLKVQ